MKENFKKVDTKEFEMPETLFSRDIESRVIQVIILHTIEKIEGVSLMGGNLIDTLFGRDVEKVKGIFVEQDSRNHMVKVKVEVLIDYGIKIPEKTEEVQNKIVEEITQLTGLHVASVHIVVKGLVLPKDPLAEERKSLAFTESLLTHDDALKNEFSRVK